jgi:Nucleotidyltransferase of unknown function (DUF6036)
LPALSFSDSGDVEAALQAVGELLEDAGERISIVIIGGAALQLLGAVSRATRDIDIVALTEQPGQLDHLIRPPQPLPEFLRRVIRTVAEDRGLAENWLNRGPAGQWDVGLPPGFATRVRWRSYAKLDVGIADRVDLIYFKLEAAADQPTSDNRHFTDLVALNPTSDELAAAARWAKEVNAGSEYHGILDRVVALATARLAGRRS